MLQLSLSCLYPQNDRGFPILSKSGIYHVKFFANGAYRRVGESNLVCREYKLTSRVSNRRYVAGRFGRKWSLCFDSKK